MNTYKGQITELKPNEVFVFGSNTQGRHGKGAALIAKTKFGAIYGKARGLMGQSYGIITKDLTKSRTPNISKETIEDQICELYGYASAYSELTFYIAYSGTGYNLNGYTPQEMAIMFSCCTIPDNIVFEEEFAKLMTKQTQWTTI